MKKAKFIQIAVSFLLVLILILTSFGCADNRYNGISTEYDDVIDEKDLEHIYEVGYHTKYYMELELNRANVIPDGEKREAPSNILNKININGKEHMLTYEESQYSVLDNGIIDVYLVDGDPYSRIKLCDGKIIAMNSYTKVNISPTATPEEALKIIKKELKNLVNISKYDNIEMPLRKDSESFDKYNFSFSNTVDGYRVDTLVVTIYDDGRIRLSDFRNLDIKVPKFNINKELENEAIELKLKNVYGDAYHSYELSDSVYSMQHRVIYYNNELYISYMIEPNLIYKGEVVSNFIEIYLIPVGMIMNK